MTVEAGRITRHLTRAAVLVAFLAPGLMVASSPPVGAAGNPGSFFDGATKYSTIINCVSIIQGSPYPESGAGVYTGGYADPDEQTPVPAVNQPFYMHVLVYGLGNACSGQRFVPAVDLPANVAFDTTNPILCFTQQGQATGSRDCPQWSNMVPSAYGGDKMYLSSDTANAQTWPLPQGAFWEFRFPIKSSRTQTNAPLHSYVKMFDGNDSPVLDASAGLFVFGAASPPSVLYDSPSTVASPLQLDGVTPTTYGIYSKANFFTNGTEGTGTFDFGTSSGQYTNHTSTTLSAGPTSWTMWSDWNEAGFAPLVPGTTYYWRARFVPTGGGSVTRGAEQHFTVPSSTTCLGRSVTVSIGLGQQPSGLDDVILGTAASQSIDGGGGNDTICGGGGNDSIDGGTGNDVMDGGAGNDSLSYASATSGVNVSLATTAPQNTGGGGVDTQSSFENLVGSSAADTLTGKGGANTLNGLAGSDTLRGGDGPDSLEGGPDNDTIDGGPGTDTATYTTATVGVRVDLSLTGSQNTIGSAVDALSAVENLTGSGKDDRLAGNQGPNTLTGRGGTDTCNGRGGTDVGVSCETKVSIP